jgi:hypothetical protein
VRKTGLLRIGRGPQHAMVRGICGVDIIVVSDDYSGDLWGGIT